MSKLEHRSIYFTQAVFFLFLTTPLHAAQYSGDINGYCKKVSDVSGGSYTIEQGCRDMENNAKEKLSRMSVSQRVFDYCKSVADVSGKSYSIMVGCIEMELDAKRKIQQ